MTNIDTYITEKLHLRKGAKYNYFPKSRLQLKKLLKQLIAERGKDAYLNDIDTSKVDKMFTLFEGLDPHHIDISEWNVSKVTDMRSMFYGCENFNCDIHSWDVRKVKNIWCMFYKCHEFDCDLSDWKIDEENLEDYAYAFLSCSAKTPDWYIRISKSRA